MDFFYFSFIVLILTFSHSPASGQTLQTTEYWYNEITGDRQEQFLWSKTSGQNRLRLSAKKEREETTLICTPTGEVLHWQQQDEKDTFLTADRSANVLSITGKKNGRHIFKRFDLDERPWYQFLSFSLQNFLQDNTVHTVVFWMLRPDTLDPLLLEATKSGIETISLDSGTIQTVKIQIAPHGLMGKIWQAHYWYRLPDFLFVMYKGTHGGFLTPETTITLAKTQD